MFPDVLMEATQAYFDPCLNWILAKLKCVKYFASLARTVFCLTTSDVLGNGDENLSVIRGIEQFTD